MRANSHHIWYPVSPNNQLNREMCCGAIALVQAVNCLWDSCDPSGAQSSLHPVLEPVGQGTSGEFLSEPHSFLKAPPYARELIIQLEKSGPSGNLAKPQMCLSCVFLFSFKDP